MQNRTFLLGMITNAPISSYYTIQLNMNTRLSVLLAFIFIVGLSACNKKNNDAPTVALKSSLNIVNASADTVNFYLNGTRLNNNSNLYPLVSTGYLTNILAGSQNFQVKKMFNPVTSTVQTLFTIPLKLDTGTNYSLYIAGETLDNAFLIPDFTQAQANQLASMTNTGDTVQTTSLVRFVNASPTVGNLDIAIGDTVKFTNVPFKTAENFTLINSGSKIPFNIYKSGTTTPLTTGTLVLSPGTAYTVYSKGALNGTNNSAFGIVYILTFSSQ